VRQALLRLVELRRGAALGVDDAVAVTERLERRAEPRAVLRLPADRRLAVGQEHADLRGGARLLRAGVRRRRSGAGGHRENEKHQRGAGEPSHYPFLLVVKYRSTALLGI